MAYLLHMWYVLGIISGICMACSCYICSKPLWNMRGMSFVYLLCLLAYGRAFLWHIHLTSMACLWPVYGVPLQYLQIVYLWHVYSVCLWYIYGYFLKFSKAQENSKKNVENKQKTSKITGPHNVPLSKDRPSSIIILNLRAGKHCNRNFPFKHAPGKINELTRETPQMLCLINIPFFIWLMDR